METKIITITGTRFKDVPPCAVEIKDSLTVGDRKVEPVKAIEAKSDKQPPLTPLFRRKGGRIEAIVFLLPGGHIDLYV